MRKTAIEGQVASVLNDEQLVINRGAYHGVKEGMRFAVLAAESLIIKDPETGDTIDEVSREKVRVEVTEAREKSCICSTYETYWTPSLRNLGMSADLFADSVEVQMTFKSNDFPEPLAEAEKRINIGDQVREIGKPSASARMSLYNRRKAAGANPSKMEVTELARVHQYLVEEKVNPDSSEFTMDFLREQVYKKGFEYRVFGRPGDWNAEVWSLRLADSPREPAKSEHFWDQESALAFALHRALRR